MRRSWKGKTKIKIRNEIQVKVKSKGVEARRVRAEEKHLQTHLAWVSTILRVLTC